MILIHNIEPTTIFVQGPDSRGLGGLMVLMGRKEKPLPLLDVKVRAQILGPFCRTVIEQRFGNTLDVPMEAVHIFPLPVDGAVVEMELRAGEIVVRAECKEKAAAEQQFAEARAAGHRAALLTAERADVHTLRITNLPPRTEVIARIVVVERLEASDGQLRWRFPTVVAPRFMPGTVTGHQGPGTASDTDFVPDASRISPPLRGSGGVRLDLEVEISGPVRSLQSSLHAVRMDLEAGGVRVAPSAKATLNKDFILSFSTADDNRAAARAWTDGKYTALLVEGPGVATMPSVPRDAVFVVDISGSMSGIKMQAAKKAMLTALHGLMPGDRFKLIAFDDRVELFKPDFCNYDDTTLKAADAWIGRLDDRGGTVMLPAITAALAGSTPPGRLRTVLFVTDGQAGDEAQLAAAVANRRGNARFFTLGIDTAVNAALLKQLARLGGGTCELCTPSDDIEAVVAKLESRFGSPLVEDLRVQGAIAARPDAEVLFGGRPVGLLLEGAASFQITGNISTGVWSEQVSPQSTTMSLGALWARERVAYLEDRLSLKPFEEEAIRPEILRVALAHGIVSRYTAMVAVDRSVTVQGKAVEVVQPVELPEGWDMEFMRGPQPQMAAPGGAYGGAIPAPPPAPSVVRSAAPVARPAPKMDAMPIEALKVSYTQAPVAGPAAPEAMEPMALGGALSMDDAEEADESSTAFFSAPAAERSRRASAPAPAKKTRKGGVLSKVADAMNSFFGEDLLMEKEAAPVVASAAPAPKAKAAPASKSEVAREEAAPSNAPALDEGALARMQGADGSFGGDIARTVAALLALLLKGHTRRSGLRSRTVTKAAAWLEQYRGQAQVDLALNALAAAERGEALQPDAAWRALCSAGAEGRALAQVLA